MDFTPYLQIYGLFNFVIKSKIQTHTAIFGLFAVPKSKNKLQCSNRVIQYVIIKNSYVKI